MIERWDVTLLHGTEIEVEAEVNTAGTAARPAFAPTDQIMYEIRVNGIAIGTTIEGGSDGAIKAAQSLVLHKFGASLAWFPCAELPFLAEIVPTDELKRTLRQIPAQVSVYLSHEHRNNPICAKYVKHVAALGSALDIVKDARDRVEADRETQRAALVLADGVFRKIAVVARLREHAHRPFDEARAAVRAALGKE